MFKSIQLKQSENTQDYVKDVNSIKLDITRMYRGKGESTKIRLLEL